MKTIRSSYRLISTAVIFALGLGSSLAQFTYKRDMANYQTPPAYSQADGELFNAPAYWSHPDFGRLTFACPMDKNVVEDISKRELNKRYYVDLDDTSFFYIEQSNVPINYWEGDNLRAIDPSLHINQHGYSATYQPYPTGIHLQDEYLWMVGETGGIRLNRFKLKVTHMDNSVQYIPADWSNIHVTNFKAYITDMFPGIDQHIEFVEGGIKTEFIVKSNPGVKSLEFIDDLFLDDNLDVLIDLNAYNLEYVTIYDTISGDNIFKMNPAFTYDNSPSPIAWIADYHLNGDALSIICDSVHLNNPSLQYPLTIDPFIVAVPATAGNAFGSDHVAEATCQDVLTINYPGGSTPWDVSLTWSVVANWCGWELLINSALVPCLMSWTQLWFTSDCGGASPTGAPATIWTCNPGVNPLCASQGTWGPTLNFGDDPSTKTLAQCYPAQCTNQNIEITANLNRTGCFSFIGNIDDCNAVPGNSICVRMAAWSATIQGRTLESLSDSLTGNGTQTIYDADCAGTQLLDPTPAYGIPNYTYSWNPGGATTPTLTVPGTVSTYTVDITDDCNNTVTATFDIGCPLSTDILSFSGDKNQDQVELIWEIEDEDGLLHYEVVRSSDGENWSPLGSVPLKSGNGNAYTFYDEEPGIGQNFYRLHLVQSDESFEYSESISVIFKNEFSVFPNPADKTAQIELVSAPLEGTQIVLFDLYGREIKRIDADSQSLSIDLSDINSGNYVIRLERNELIYEVRRLTINH